MLSLAINQLKGLRGKNNDKKPTEIPEHNTFDA
jgi:hypothetical protein